MRTTFLTTFAIVATLSIGCGENSQPQITSNGNSVSTGSALVADGFTPVRPAKIYDDPKESVRAFLNAVTTGDDATATSLLTTKAQRETWANGLALTSDGFPGARFEITEVENRSATEAHVETMWVDEQQNTYPCVWLLRKEPHGWCIFGMATKFMDAADPVILPFEDHSEMARRQKAAIQQMQEYQRQQVATSPQHQASRVSTTQPVAGRERPIQQASRTTDFR